MKIGIYGAGAFCRHVNREIPFIAVDGGIISLQQLNLQPKYIVGDFDSVDFKKIEHFNHITKLPTKKDDTDTEVAIKNAIALGYDEIELYGVTGGRLDHFFSICRLLVKYEDVKITVIDDLNRIYLLNKGSHIINKDAYDYISFFAIQTTDLSISNVVYPLNHYMLTYDNPLCVSNEIVGESCFVETSQTIFCIQSKKGEF